MLFLSSSYVKLYKIATSTWMTNLWEFIHIYWLEVCIPILKIPTLLCANDNTIVEALVKLGWSDENLRLTNQVRLYLKTYFILDLLMSSNNRIKRCVAQGTMDENAHSKHSWSVMQRKKTQFFIWKNMQLTWSIATEHCNHQSGEIPLKIHIEE